MQRWRTLLVVVAGLLAGFIDVCDGEQLSVQASDISSEHPSSTSLCGENLTKETGTLNGLFYVFYESTASSAHGPNIPVILWLSGGPGCSGLVALLFENGPCAFDDEADILSLNPYSWTGLAHVIYIDQPRGTGYSGTTVPSWTLDGAMDDVHTFLKDFFAGHQALQASDFYIFGESYAGHYVPGLAAKVTKSSAGLPTLKGVGIGNGVVSTTAWVDSAVPFSKGNDYGLDYIGESSQEIQRYSDQFKASMDRCSSSSGNLRGIDSKEACKQALQALHDFDAHTSQAVYSRLGRNVYDVRRECHRDDPLGLCYRFQRLQDLVNTPEVSAYFGEAPSSWALCASIAVQLLAGMDQVSESEALIAEVLGRGVRVLVYGGAADTVVNWMSQDEWTRQLQWPHSAEFCSAPFVDKVSGGRRIGRVRTAHGLSFMKIYDAGHMVPHDQPAVAFEMVRSFLYDAPGALFS